MSKYINTDMIRALTMAQTEAMLRAIENPAADVVEIIRCKDCKWCRQIKKRPEFGFTDEVYTCDKFDAYYKEMTPEELNDFCSYGERRAE